MKYSNGRIIRIGDRVKLPNGEVGTVVCSIDTNEFGQDFPENEWRYLTKGVMIETDIGALVHYTDSNHKDLIPIGDVSN